MRKQVQSGVRLSKSENFKRHFEHCVGDSKQRNRFLDLIRGVRKNSEHISTVKGKSGARIVNKRDSHFLQRSLH